MKNLVNIFLLFCGAIILVSCEPGRAENGDLLFGLHDGTNPTGVSKKLKMLTSVDGSGDVLVFTYNYSADGKLKSVTSSDHSVDYDLSYDTDNLINKIRVTQTDSTGITTTNFDLTYENKRFKEAKGAGTESTGDVIKNTITATYNTNNKVSQILSKAVIVDAANPSVTQDLYSIQNDLAYNINNISNWKSTLKLGQLPPMLINTTLGNYDTHVNPFHQLPEVFNIFTSIFGIDNVAVTGLSANNYRQVSVVANSDTQSATYTLTYDADGYPTKAVASDNHNTLTFQYQ